MTTGFTTTVSPSTLQITITATVSVTECTERLINGTRSVAPAWHSTIDSAALIVAEVLSHM